MAKSSNTKPYLLLSAFCFTFCLGNAFWLTTFADVFNYILAASWAFIGCVNLSLSITDYVDEKIKAALRPQDLDSGDAK